MKKLYTKPFIAVESFQLNAAIAAGCNDPSNNITAIGHDLQGCTPFEEKPTEQFIGPACADLGHDLTNSYINEDGICYNAMEGIIGMYFES